MSILTDMRDELKKWKVHNLLKIISSWKRLSILVQSFLLYCLHLNFVWKNIHTEGLTDDELHNSSQSAAKANNKLMAVCWHQYIWRHCETIQVRMLHYQTPKRNVLHAVCWLNVFFVRHVCICSLNNTNIFWPLVLVLKIGKVHWTQNGQPMQTYHP